MTWMVAVSQGMRAPLCQILEVGWMGIRVEKLLRLRRAHSQQGIASGGSLSRIVRRRGNSIDPVQLEWDSETRPPRNLRGIPYCCPAGAFLVVVQPGPSLLSSSRGLPCVRA